MDRGVFLLVATLLLASALFSDAAHGDGMPDYGRAWGGGIPEWGAGGGRGMPGYPWRGRGWGNTGGGWGAGYGSPSGGYSRHGTMMPSVVCREKGHCYGKKLTCPAKCFTSFSRSGKNYAARGGGGGCTMDCKRCVAYC